MITSESLEKQALNVTKQVKSNLALLGSSFSEIKSQITQSTNSVKRIALNTVGVIGAAGGSAYYAFAPNKIPGTLQIDSAMNDIDRLIKTAKVLKKDLESLKELHQLNKQIRRSQKE